MSFYPLLTTLNTVHEGNNVSHTIVYVEDTTPTWGAPGVGVSTGGQSYPVTITTDMPNSTVNTSGNTIVGYYTDAFTNQISYRATDESLITVTKWADIVMAIANETLLEVYHYHADPRSRIVYTYTAAANGHTQSYTINVDNDWLTGRNRLIKYVNLPRYQQKILVQWINNNGDKVPWTNNLLDSIDWENSNL